MTCSPKHGDDVLLRHLVLGKAHVYHKAASAAGPG
ncbi:hypothetical protein TcasGA2_TC031047 [Tribolium castaneum]|uniref:Uncharacterized protein n=1 Tax=Tribolium castaneum TaxID=7070 RepID=A0A139WKT6_TRICA|nr:hypothetical protein TcasGA2_TC031047 [Tribolium castaneum]